MTDNSELIPQFTKERVLQILNRLMVNFKDTFAGGPDDVLTKEDLNTWILAELSERKAKMIKESMSHLTSKDLVAALLFTQDEIHSYPKPS